MASTLSLSLAAYNFLKYPRTIIYPPHLFPSPSELGSNGLFSWKCKKDYNYNILSCSKTEGVVEIVSKKTRYEDDEFVVVNFYRFVYIKDPQHEVSTHLSFLQVFFCSIYLFIFIITIIFLAHFFRVWIFLLCWFGVM